METRRQELRSSTSSVIEIINSARLGTKDYDFDSVKSVKIIKEGGHSIVFSINSKIDGKKYVAKRLKYQIEEKYYEEEIQAMAEREIGSLKVLDHPMIMGIVDIVKDRHNFPWIIMEQYTHSLQKTIKEYPDQFIPETHVLRVLTMICIPLYHIHSNNIVHCDFRPDNILSKFLGNQEIFMITEFGVSQNLNRPYKITIEEDMPSSYARFFYSSIEQLDEEDAHPSFDIWSLGITLYKLMAKIEPYRQCIAKIFKPIKENQRERLPEIYSQELRDLVDYLLTLDQSTRPTIEQVLRQPIISAEIDKILDDFRPLTNDQSTASIAQKIIEHILEIYPEKRINRLQIQPSNNESQDLILYQSNCAIKPIEIANIKDLLQERRVATSLQYRGSEHGWMAKDFYLRAPKVGATLLLLKLKDGPCIGGFTQAQWKQTNDSIGISDETAMIFNLTKKKGYPVKIQQRAISCFKNTLSFGDEEIQINEPFNQISNCKSWANNGVYCIQEKTNGKNRLTLQKTDCFTITEIELWKVTGDLPQGQFGVQSLLSNQNDNSERWRSYQILKNEENKLGEGTFADVYKIKEKKSQTIYAAKIIKVQSLFMDSGDKLSLERELQIMKDCNHPLIIKLIEQFQFQNQQVIVTSYASGGNLRNLIDQHQNFTLEEIMNFFSMILISLNYLHANSIIQRDLHPRNILINILPGGFKILQITDFGLSKNVKNQDIQSQSLADRTATLYKAPEVFKGETPTTKVDMWALGIILFELTTKQHPISKVVEITDPNPLQIPQSIPPLIRALIQNLLDKNPATRPSAEELLNIPEVNEAVNHLAKQIKTIDPNLATMIFESPKKFK